MSDKHTPGPWEFRVGDSGFIRAGRSGASVAQANGARPEADANARLIAALTAANARNEARHVSNGR